MIDNKRVEKLYKKEKEKVCKIYFKENARKQKEAY